MLFERTNILGAIRTPRSSRVLTVASNVFLSCVGATFSRGWTGRNIMYFSASAMIFPFESIMLSLFKMMAQLDLYNTLPAFDGRHDRPLPDLAMRAAFAGIPEEIEDAALIDGRGAAPLLVDLPAPGTRHPDGRRPHLLHRGLVRLHFPLLMLPDPDKQTLMLADGDPELAPGRHLPAGPAPSWRWSPSSWSSCLVRSFSSGIEGWRTEVLISSRGCTLAPAGIFSLI